MSDLPKAHGFEVAGDALGCAIRRAPGYSGQHALAVLLRGVEQRAFPGAAFAVLCKGETVLQGAVGRFTYSEGAEDVTLSTVFDLASVTKAVATTAMAMLLYERGKLNLDQPVVELLPEFASADDSRRRQVTVEMLLAHSSGLPAYVKLFRQASDRASLLELAFQVSLEVAPGSRAEYSDIGFILLGELLQRIADESLDYFCTREIFSRLGMKSTFFCPADRLRGSIPPTVDDRQFRHRIQGEVHDENASVMGGVSGHAGMFSNTADLMKFSASMLGLEPQLLHPETIRLFTRRQASPPGTSRALGWDTPSTPSQSGKHFSPNSFGHLGYTGTSLWIDGERRIAIALLTNRTWPDRRSQLIKQVRPAFHDAVMEEVLKIS